MNPLKPAPGRLSPQQLTPGEQLLTLLVEAQRLAERIRDAGEPHRCDGGLCDRCQVLDVLDDTIRDVNGRAHDLVAVLVPVPRVEVPGLPCRQPS